jgi:hypothetical protein
MNKNIFLIIILGMVLISFASATNPDTYQENANRTSHTGVSSDWGDAYDGNWNTYSSTGDGDPINLYVNYTKLIGTSENSLWRVKDRNEEKNLSIPIDCWNNNATTLILKVYADISSLMWNCYNTTGWKRIGNQTGTLSGRIFEEAIWWDVDFNSPIIFLVSGNGTQTYGGLTTNHTLNYTITDTNLHSCWINYNSTNRTIPCTTGSTNTTNFTLQLEVYNATIWANDSIGNTYGRFVEWDYQVFENTRANNATTFETKDETFSINLTSNSSLTAVHLIYNGTAYAMTNTSNVWSKTLSIPSSAVGTQSFNYKFTYGGSTFYSGNSTQVVNPLIFAWCNSTYNTKFVNYTFKDESDLSTINATIPLATFYYWIGDSTLNKTLTYTNTSLNYSFRFCSNAVNSTINVVPYIQYKQGTAYPQRVYQSSTLHLTNTTTNTTLYLLAVADGIYITFQVTNPSNQVISGVTINSSREISGSDVLVAQGVTGDDGTVTFWLNPDYSHEFYFIKSGFETLVSSITPTQSSYTVVLGGSSATQINDYSKGITIKIKPTAETTLFNDTEYNFNMTISTSYWDLDDFGIFIRLSNGTVIGSDSDTTSSGGVLNLLRNTSINKIIYMDYYYTVNGTNTTGTARWTIISSAYSGYSILTFFTDFKLYMTSGMFGLDAFGLNLIIFLCLFISIGLMSYKYSMTSPLAISLMAFLCIFFFDVVLGLLTSPPRMIPHVYTWLIGLVTSVFVIKEVIQ